MATEEFAISVATSFAKPFWQKISGISKANNKLNPKAKASFIGITIDNLINLTSFPSLITKMIELKFNFKFKNMVAVFLKALSNAFLRGFI